MMNVKTIAADAVFNDMSIGSIVINALQQTQNFKSPGHVLRKYPGDLMNTIIDLY